MHRQLVMRCLPAPRKFFDIMRSVEGTSAAGVHPGDWRYVNFDYE